MDFWEVLNEKSSFKSRNSGLKKTPWDDNSGVILRGRSKRIQRYYCVFFDPTKCFFSKWLATLTVGLLRAWLGSLLAFLRQQARGTATNGSGPSTSLFCKMPPKPMDPVPCEAAAAGFGRLTWRTVAGCSLTCRAGVVLARLATTGKKSSSNLGEPAEYVCAIMAGGASPGGAMIFGESKDWAGTTRRGLALTLTWRWKGFKLFETELVAPLGCRRPTSAS